ncbi:EF-P 5-aminopentanol modification-associated protein YfmF [Gracilibacillus thailandensis]|uniref:Insulinase family protein n=1 Tax=Gracilibacillus thailandensis TaxID=563735 RepID=A0A6N7R2N3_9BACI|nr:pitrilysin family protein [Gracilibacillus thailandensis]MRI65406.1 insulinase family protein [Gracilibacillus thailandensis]
MAETLERIIPREGYDLHLIHTKKFKTIHLSLKFTSNLTRDNITKRALLPYILQQGTENYPTAIQLRQHLDELYGTVLAVDSSKKGENHIFTIRLELPNEQYIAGSQDLLDKGIAFLREIIYQPKLVNQAFDPKIVAREKETLRSKIESLKEDKMSFANTRMIEEMCKEEAYRLRVHGYEEDLDEITAEDLYSYYQQILNHDHLDVFAVGDIDGLDVEEKITALVEERQQQPIEKAMRVTKDSEQTLIEEDDIKQAKLHFGYRTNITFNDEDYPALHVFNGLFGGFPSSKLFMNVREKHSLAYYAASRIESHKGLMFVFSGIAPEQYEKAKTIILEQMEQMRNGEFSDDQLSETKEMTVNQLRETLDNPQGMIELHYQSVLAKSSITPEQLLQKVNTVTKEQVINVANKIKLDTIYLLTSKEAEQSEA